MDVPPPVGREHGLPNDEHSQVLITMDAQQIGDCAGRCRQVVHGGESRTTRFLGRAVEVPNEAAFVKIGESAPGGERRQTPGEQSRRERWKREHRDNYDGGNPEQKSPCPASSKIAARCPVRLYECEEEETHGTGQQPREQRACLVFVSVNAGSVFGPAGYYYGNVVCRGSSRREGVHL